MLFASEMKCLVDDCIQFEQFRPGHIWSSKTRKYKRYYNPGWMVPKTVPSNPLDLDQIRDVLSKAVTKRLMSDVPFGVLLSGGLDSSLVASIAARHLSKESSDGTPSNR